jgi:hypothetical protein
VPEFLTSVSQCDVIKMDKDSGKVWITEVVEQSERRSRRIARTMDERKVKWSDATGLYETNRFIFQLEKLFFLSSVFT